MKGFILLCLATLTLALRDHMIKKRVLPINKACRPDTGICRKGDWIAEDIASCHYDSSGAWKWTCDAMKDTIFETADVATKDSCKPTSGKQIRCGEQGTNTRCVCSDKNVIWIFSYNECKCQYWPPEDIGAHAPAFCTAYYSGGSSGVHQWTCCNNCQDPTPNTCDAETWHGGGSSNSYCNGCGQNTGGGRVKYYFNCGGCETQQHCSEYCSSGIRKVYKITPGLCWKWLECFKGCCLSSSIQPRAKRDAELSFCGDGICSETESPTDCPADCCYLVNSVNCTSGVNNCSHECCNEPHCCLDDNSSDNDDDQRNGSGGNGSLKSELVHVSVAIIVVFFVLPMVGIILTLAKVCYSKKLYTKKKEKKKEKGPDYDKL